MARRMKTAQDEEQRARHVPIATAAQCERARRRTESLLQSGAIRRPADLGLRPRTSRAGSDPIVAPLFIGTLPTLPCRSWRFSRSATMSAAKRRCAIAPALQATPSPLASSDSQIVRRQWVPPATVAWNFLAPGFAAIDIGEVDDRRTISTDQAPATKIIILDSIT
jgi:hypothetical protein